MESKFEAAVRNFARGMGSTLSIQPNTRQTRANGTRLRNYVVTVNGHKVEVEVNIRSTRPLAVKRYIDQIKGAITSA